MALSCSANTMNVYGINNKMNDPIFELEQEIMQCWSVIDDIKIVTEHFIDSAEYKHMPPDIADAIMNKYLAIKELYELKFEKCWNTFEKVCAEYHARGKYSDTTVMNNTYIQIISCSDSSKWYSNLIGEKIAYTGIVPALNGTFEYQCRDTDGYINFVSAADAIGFYK